MRGLVALSNLVIGGNIINTGIRDAQGVSSGKVHGPFIAQELPVACPLSSSDNNVLVTTGEGNMQEEVHSCCMRVTVNFLCVNVTWIDELDGLQKNVRVWDIQHRICTINSYGKTHG